MRAFKEFITHYPDLTLLVWGWGLCNFLRHKYPPPGQLVSVGSHRLHLHCQGEGKITVILKGETGYVGS